MTTNNPLSGLTQISNGQDSDSGKQANKLKFLNSTPAKAIYNPHGLQTPVSPYQLMAGTVISASLISGLNSDLPSQVMAQVTSPVYDTVTGQHLLIPQGARLIGKYDSVVAFGQERALVVWYRLILPNGTSMVIDNLPASDEAGFAGLKDPAERKKLYEKIDKFVEYVHSNPGKATWQGTKGLLTSIVEGAYNVAAKGGDFIYQSNPIEDYFDDDPIDEGYAAGKVAPALIAFLNPIKKLGAGLKAIDEAACFRAGTLIWTAKGMKPIEEIKVGDMVVSQAENGGQTVLRPVVRLFQRFSTHILKVELKKSNGTIELFETTNEHPFHVPGHGFVKAANLKVGDWVSSGVGKDPASAIPLLTVASKADDPSGFLKVKSLTLEKRLEVVYNFEVADTHTYFVGETKAWVHNKCGIPPWGTKSPLPRADNLLPTGKSRDYIKGHMAGVLTNGKLKIDDMMSLVPKGTKNTFKPTANIKEGFVYKFKHKLDDGSEVNLTVRAHSANSNAPVGSYSRNNWTGTISVGRSNLRTNGQWHSNDTLPDVHLPFE